MPQNPSISLDYCERINLTSLSFEPLNTISNLAFLVAALVLLIRYWQPCPNKRNKFDILALILLIASIFIGSSLWHIHATNTYMLADVIPITIFIHLYIFAFLYRIAKFSILKSTAILSIFLIINGLTNIYIPANTLNGSILYIPAYLTMIIMAIYLNKIKNPSFIILTKTTIIFTASLFFRTIDFSVCNYITVGTHFIWHILNAMTLYNLVFIVFNSKDSN